MKKKVICLLSAAILAAMTTLPSCLEGGSNTMTDTVVGVVRFDTKTFRNVLDVAANAAFYSPAFANMEEGACCHIYYELNYEDPSNTAEMLAANGYYTVTVMDKVELNRYSLRLGADTSLTAATDETPIVEAGQVFGYVKGIVFMAHKLIRPADQRTDWEFSYNWNNPSVNEDGDNVYDLYLRAKIRIADTKTAEEAYESCAYDMKGFLESAAQVEKNLGKTLVILRFHYVSEINDGVATWSVQTDDLGLDIEMILPES